LLPPPLKLSVTPGGTAELDGRWSLGPQSVVGYRVREKLTYLPAPSDAVGRTNAIKGSLLVEHRAMTKLDLRADLRTLQSDRAERDGVLQNEGPEFAKYPEARFVLAAPVALDGLPEQVGHFRATGDLTLHEVTRRVTIPFQAAVSGRTLQAVGSLKIRFKDYRFDPPKRPIVSIRPTGALEFRLVFEPSSR